ncbi:MAG: SPOR domain-containing protein [Candidatus Marinimicrobia bacterium]|nr:SPOR domain-containing protein [Candidatus Neomarinimicrobiota bacterium]
MRKLFLFILIISMIIIFGCTKTNTGFVGEPVDIYIDKKPANVLEYKWAFKNKPIESRLDPRDFIPSDYAETVTFIPDIPGNYEIIVVMVDDRNQEYDQKFKYKINESSEFGGNYLEETPADTVDKFTQTEKETLSDTAEISKDKQPIAKDEWENAPKLTKKEKKSPRPKKQTIQSQRKYKNNIRLYTIQFSSSHYKKYSEDAVKRLGRIGYDAYIEKFYLKNDPKPWYRVRVGNYSSLKEARSNKLSLERKTRQKGIWIDKK